MRRWLLCALAAVGLVGCGVSKEIYQSELVHSQGLEARSADLEARLQVEATKRREAEDSLAACGDRASALASDLTRADARGTDLDGQLSGCLKREARLQADLDLTGKTRSAAEGERDAERQARREETRRLEAEAAGLRARLDQQDAAIAELVSEKERLEREKREKLDEISSTYEGLLEGMKDEVAKGRVTISQLRGKLSVNVLDEILFDSGSAAVKAEGKEVLGRIGEVLIGLEDKAIVIEGHTDTVPISGELAKRFATNWELSTARATSVVRYLQDTAGIAPERLSAVGFGPYHPVAANDTPEGRARNRRIEIKLVPLESPLLPEAGSEGQAPTGETPGANTSPDSGAEIR